ncbi:MAG: Hypothetical, related to broad specificity phosphatases COG0406, partial [uncultured Acetobacteraceae bacterium]
EPALARSPLGGPPRRKQRQRRAGCGPRGQPAADRGRRPGRGRAPEPAGRAAVERPRQVVRRHAARGAARGGARLALRPRAPNGVLDPRRWRHRRGAGGLRGGRKAARTGVRRPRPVDPLRHRAAAPGAGRVPPRPRQVLPPPPGRRELVRRHPPPAERPRHGGAAPRRGARAGGRPPSGGAVPALLGGADDGGADPGRGRGGRCGELRRHGVRLRPRPRGGRRPFAAPLQLRRAPGAGRRARYGGAGRFGRRPM